MGRIDMTTLLSLVSDEVIGSYLDWEINEKGVSAAALGSLFGLLAAVHHYPKYKDVDFGWFKRLLDQIPKESQSTINNRKQKKYLPHVKLSTIPEKISALRKREKKGTRVYAQLLHDELMVRVLLTLAWRQRNIREARLGERESDNIFKDGFESNVNIAKPQWVLDALTENPKATFWQIYFRPHETKTGSEIRGVLPAQLAVLVEEYITECRPLLAGKGAGSLLFVNRVGNPLKSNELTSLIGNLTARYCAKRVTPHLFRDAFAHRWLDEHPDDYLSLSKILWHRDVKTTIQIYGRNFDESHGMKKAEEWLAEHQQSDSPPRV